MFYMVQFYVTPPASKYSTSLGLCRDQRGVLWTGTTTFLLQVLLDIARSSRCTSPCHRVNGVEPSVDVLGIQRTVHSGQGVGIPSSDCIQTTVIHAESPLAFFAILISYEDMVLTWRTFCHFRLLSEADIGGLNCILLSFQILIQI